MASITPLLRRAQRKARENAKNPVPVEVTPGMTLVNRQTVEFEHRPPELSDRVPWADRPDPNPPRVDPVRVVRAWRWATLRALEETGRTPAHLWHVAIWTIWGARRAVTTFLDWALAREYRRLAEILTEQGRPTETGEMLAAVRLHRKGRVLPAFALLFTAAALAAPVVVASPKITAPTRIAVALLDLALLAAYGKGTPGKFVEIKESSRYVTRDAIGEAFDLAGFKNVATIGSVERFGRRPFTGSRLLVKLDARDVATDTIKAIPKIASALETSRTQLHLEPSTVNERLVTVTISDSNPVDAAPPTHPLLHVKTHNTWDDGAPLGVNHMGVQVNAPLRDQHLLFVGRQNSGKSSAITEIIAATLKDPLYDRDVFEFKGDDYYRPVEPHCGTYLTPATAGSLDAAAEQFLAYLQETEALALQAQAFLGSLPIPENRWGKVTREMAAKYPLLRPRLIVGDELQNALETPSGPLILKASTRLARTIRNLGWTIAVGLQRAPRATVEDLRSFLTVRFVLPVREADDSRMALGGEHENGVIDASLPGLPPGVGFLSGPGIPVGLVRTFEMNRGVLADIAGQTPAETRETSPRPPSPVVLAKATPLFPQRVLHALKESDWLPTPEGPWVPVAVVAERLGGKWDARLTGRELRGAGVEVAERSWREGAETFRKTGVYRSQLS